MQRPLHRFMHAQIWSEYMHTPVGESVSIHAESTARIHAYAHLPIRPHTCLPEIRPNGPSVLCTAGLTSSSHVYVLYYGA